MRALGKSVRHPGNAGYGYGGNDDLDGGTGGDTMFGGDGNDGGPGGDGSGRTNPSGTDGSDSDLHAGGGAGGGAGFIVFVGTIIGATQSVSPVAIVL